MSILYWICWLIVFIPIRILYPTKIINKEYFRKKGKAIFACNHTSNLDIIILKTRQYKKSYVLAKHTLFKNKFLGACFKSFGAIPVNREEVSVSSIKQTLKVLKDDKQLIIFPEGTRKSSLEESESLKNGMAMFALKAQAEIVPMVFLRKPKLFRMNTIIVGEPICMEEYAGVKASKEVMEEISQKVLTEMKNLRDSYIATLSEKKQKKLLKQN